MRDSTGGLTLRSPTAVLILANLTAYALTSILSRNPLQTSTSVIIIFGQSNYLVENGAYWQLLTSIFIHANLPHILGNMLFLLIFGLRAEEIFNKKEYAAIYFGSGILGNIASLSLGPTVISSGASGAIFGLFGATVIYLRRIDRQSITSALVYSFYLLLFTIGPTVNIIAHFIGLISGLLIGYLLAAFHQNNRVVQYTTSYR